MTIKIELASKKSRQRKQKKRKKTGIGFTNRLAIFLLLFLVAGLIGGFALSVLSIKYQYVGPLACWTVVFAPVGTAIGIVIGKVVDKNKSENVGGNGDGITFASAQAKGFSIPEDDISNTV